MGIPPWVASLAAIALLIGAACTSQSSSLPDLATTLEMRVAGREGCPTSAARVRCYQTMIRNIGNREGDGTCRLEPRNGSPARFVNDGNHVRVPSLSPGASIGQTVIVRAAKDGKFWLPIMTCNPGPAI